MIVVSVLASGCVSRRTYLAKNQEAGLLALALANEQKKTATLSTRAGELERQLADSRKSLEGVTGERDRLAAETAQRRSEQADLSRRLADAESRVAALEAERDRLAGDTQAGEARAQELAAELEAARRDLEARRRELEAARQELEARRGELEATRGDLATARQTLSGTQDELATARQTLGETQGRITRGQQEIESARGELATTERDLAGAVEERDRIAAERDAARQELDATRRELETARGELAATEQALAQARGEVTSVRQALSGTQGELTSVKQSLGATKEEMEARERKLAEAIAAHDKLVSDLRREIDEGQVQISRLKDKLTVRVLDRILFDSGSARIKPSGQEVLRKVADTVRTLTDQEVHIEGHTDNVPIKESYRDVFATNWELSTARATGVARFLQEKATVDPRSLAAVGYGEYRPVEPNDTPDGRSQNRRIEIVLVPRDAETATQ
jgi:chemotaxis protein MotB